jgi:hypothetical protein
MCVIVILVKAAPAALVMVINIDIKHSTFEKKGKIGKSKLFAKGNLKFKLYMFISHLKSKTNFKIFSMDTKLKYISKI